MFRTNTKTTGRSLKMQSLITKQLNDLFTCSHYLFKTFLKRHRPLEIPYDGDGNLCYTGNCLGWNEFVFCLCFAQDNDHPIWINESSLYVQTTSKMRWHSSWLHEWQKKWVSTLKNVCVFDIFSEIIDKNAIIAMYSVKSSIILFMLNEKAFVYLRNTRNQSSLQNEVVCTVKVVFSLRPCEH